MRPQTIFALTGTLAVALATSLMAALGPPAPAEQGRTPLRRLTRYEYNRSIRDLFGFDFDLEPYLQKDNANDGFTNNAALAFATTDRVHQYLAASQFVAETALGLNDVLTYRQHHWRAEEMLAENPNLSLMNRLGRYFADLQGHVKKGPRAPDPPRLHLVDVENRGRQAR